MKILTTLVFLGMAASAAFADDIAWQSDYAAAVAKAKESGKPVLIYFTGEH